MPRAILHVMRSPVGGLFRHVVDLAREQSARGHRVGIVADASTGGERAAGILTALDAELALGVTRVAMSRDLGPSDWSAGRHVARRLAAMNVDVVHGHGSKGGAYARLVGGDRLKVYTPHGGSLHYSRRTPVGLVYLTLERLLAARTDLFLFESAFGRDAFRAKVCEPKGLVKVVHNGVGPAEFEPVARLDATAAPGAAAMTDLLFIGELRHLKGVDVLIDAIAELRRHGRRLTATLVGAGPDAGLFQDQAERLGLTGSIIWPGALPAREAFARGRLMVVPSRAESLPYVVLEAGAAGLPQIATAVGGIGEIFGPDAGLLIRPGDALALAAAIAASLDDPAAAEASAARLRERIGREFSIAAMTDGVLAAYDEALGRRAV
ncbi:glycosyltransferase [Phreatobacter stygius]|uniref:Glycosyltransferase family 4 protein n=1 Tax=Phreatobacter stygius TaxID=1940610 RepID=A0A4D7BMA4_9HYPH|nr:glycosyltransferase [Phreatobacter stygius]QCI68877.1 glycosyltransferase family 4 protein [Phreatobacter stygius]